MSRLLDIVKEEGYEVRVSHRRPIKEYPLGLFTKHDLRVMQEEEVILGEMNNMDVVELEFDLRGGETVVRIIDTQVPDDPPLSMGIAICSFTDAFNRKVGLDIALKRALQHLGRGDLIARCYAS